MINGIDEDDRSGRSVSSAGNINGDGFDDLVIEALLADPPSDDGGGDTGPNPGGVSASRTADIEDSGEIYVIFGADFTEAVTHLGDSENNELTGDSGSNVMIGGGGDDTMIGGGGVDVLRGSQGDDILAVSDASFRRVTGGNGIDMLRLDAPGATLDLTNIADS